MGSSRRTWTTPTSRLPSRSWCPPPFVRGRTDGCARPSSGLQRSSWTLHALRRTPCLPSSPWRRCAKVFEGPPSGARDSTPRLRLRPTLTAESLLLLLLSLSLQLMLLWLLLSLLLSL